MTDHVMLASSRTGEPEALIRTLTDQGFVFELKMDGVRAVLHHSLHPKLTNRTGKDITYRYPDVVATWGRDYRSLAGRDVVLDGELLVLREGVPHFPSIHRRDAQENQLDIRRLMGSMPATFIPFDILRLDGRDVRALPYVARRDLLVETVGLEQAVYATDDGLTLWQVVMQSHLEGLIAKRRTSVYRPGRSTAWIKIKTTRTGLVLASGYRPGKGGLGSITMAVWSEADNRLVEVGHVASGFKATELRTVQQKLDAFVVHGDPLILEVSFLEIAGGKLRHPVFLRLITDVEVDHVTLEALLG